VSGYSRRKFLQAGAAVMAVGAARTHGLLASPFGLPIGLQLYSVREMLAKDYEGTLKQIAGLGYTEVEAAGFYGRTPEQVSAAMQAAGLRCVSAHYSYNDLSKDVAGTIAFNKALGVQYVICAFPGIKDPSRLKEKTYQAMLQAFTMEDYRWNAEQFNAIGEQVNAAGMRFGYHNHTMEFQADKSAGGVVPLDEMIRLTDPKLVTFELDCGWVMVGGANPVEYLKKYPERISMLHVKDFKTRPKVGEGSILHPPDAAELGHGTVDYKPVFAAAKRANIRHYFVEQEGFDMPPLEALKIDEEYMKNLNI